MTLADWVIARPVSVDDEMNGPTPGPEPGDAERHIENDRNLVDWTCAVCGHPLGEHVVDHSEGHTIFECPVDDLNGAPLPEAVPLNEVGQPKHVRQPGAER
ncbi:hypothetical protein DF220_01100 [Salinibacterium hongtaonis]|uniref:Uncharacterized protein n=2 Tax=Homoserinimonas hongtaonis TaxID=2079791 RepID=A0A2U1SY87_9MICO|nr:hypothetical protein C2138_05945 [Salinibacterium hongtaonis]PWB96587.1 hypothetical protein DF220_01100 [Salinibacterium hongtaonis]